MSPDVKLKKVPGLNRDVVLDVDDFITLLYAAGNRLFSLRRNVAKSIGLNSPEFAAILAIARLDQGEGVRIKALADDVHIAATNMTATINALHQNGWVNKLADPEDSRAVRVSLTPTARHRLSVLGERIALINAQWFSGATDEQVKQACQVFNTLLNNYEQTQAIVNALDFSATFKNDAIGG